MRGSCSYRKNGMFAKIECAREARCGCNDIRRHRLGAFPKVVEFGDGENGKFDYSNMERNGVGYPIYSAFCEEWWCFAGLFNVRLTSNTMPNTAAQKTTLLVGNKRRTNLTHI